MLFFSRISSLTGKKVPRFYETSCADKHLHLDIFSKFAIKRLQQLERQELFLGARLKSRKSKSEREKVFNDKIRLRIKHSFYKKGELCGDVLLNTKAGNFWENSKLNLVVLCRSWYVNMLAVSYSVHNRTRIPFFGFEL
jgi:hypothetical protein